MTVPPPGAPRLVATDIDGTLVDSEGRISARTRRAIQAVEDLGALFVLVTGRPPRWMADISEQTGHAGLAVCANGAIVYDLHEQQVIATHLLEADLLAEVIVALREQVPGIAFAVERGDLTFGHEEAYVAPWRNPHAVVCEHDDLVAQGAVKLLARLPDTASTDEAEVLLEAARVGLGERATMTHSIDAGLLEISAPGITKASGLAILAEDAAIDASGVIAFGDMPNDLPMLAWAGHAVAVANAHPEVLAAADEVTASNDEDGVAVVLERWFS